MVDGGSTRGSVWMLGLCIGGCTPVGPAPSSEGPAGSVGEAPVHRVRAGERYPPLLMLAADSDDRVDPMHARKYVAAMQHVANEVPVLLRIEEGAGHGGADMIRQAVEQGVDTYAFLLEQLAGS
jgi:hypothetical protein